MLSPIIVAFQDQLGQLVMAAAGGGSAWLWERRGSVTALMDLRPGIILTVTGIIALVVVLMPSRPNKTLSRRNGVIIAIALLALGIPLLVIGALGQ